MNFEWRDFALKRVTIHIDNSTDFYNFLHYCEHHRLYVDHDCKTYDISEVRWYRDVYIRICYPNSSDIVLGGEEIINKTTVVEYDDIRDYVNNQLKRIKNFAQDNGLCLKISYYTWRELINGKKSKKSLIWLKEIGEYCSYEDLTEEAIRVCHSDSKYYTEEDIQKEIKNAKNKKKYIYFNQNYIYFVKEEFAENGLLHRELSIDGDYDVRNIILREVNNNNLKFVLNIMKDDEDSTIRMSCISKMYKSDIFSEEEKQTYYRYFLNDENDLVKAHAIGHLNDEELLSYYYKNGNETIRSSVVIATKNKDILNKAIKDPSVEVRQRLTCVADNNMLLKLAKDKKAEVRETVTYYGDEDCLRLLANDRSSKVKLAVIKRIEDDEKLKNELLPIIIKSKAKKVRVEVAKICGESLLDILVTDEVDEVRIEVANRKIPKYLELLLNDDCQEIKKILIENDYGLDKFLNDKSAHIRKLAANKKFNLDLEEM